MKLKLKDYQEVAVEGVVTEISDAVAKYEANQRLSAVSLSAPTGAGKTVIATAVIEKLLVGDGTREPNPNTTVLWVTDDPNLNEQTSRKMLTSSDTLKAKQLVTIDQSFDQRTFDPGFVYFINIQKLGKGSTKYVKAAPGELGGRKYSLWTTISETISQRPGDFVLIIDEAHRGAAARSGGGQSITAKLIEDADGELPPTPVVLGISATPERFVAAITTSGTRVLAPVTVKPDDVRESGLLKDKIRIRHPAETQPGDSTLVEMAVRDLESYTEQWAAYAEEQNEPLVQPILVLQAKPASSDAELSSLLASLRGTWGELQGKAVAHSFQSHTTLDLGEHSVRYVAPQDIQGDPHVRVVLFKEALATGWDCPRAEVMVSLRPAQEHTYIAQLIGRMVRTPLARRITTNDVLNGVALYLPYFQTEHVAKVVANLGSDTSGITATFELDPVTCGRNKDMPKEVWELLEELPTYTRPARYHRSDVARVNAFAALLVGAELDAKAMDAAKQHLVATLATEASLLGDALQEKYDDLETLTYNTQVIDVFTKEVSTRTDTVAVNATNINDLFRTARRTLNDAAAKWYWDWLCTEGGEDPTDAKLRVAALATFPAVVEALNAAAKALVQKWSKKYSSEIAKLPEAWQDQFATIWGQAKTPEQIRLILPGQITAATKRIVGTGDSRSTEPLERYKHHLYANGSKTFPAKLTGWEEDVLAAASADKHFIGWYRNPTGGPAAVAVPYDQSGVARTMYPDFIMFCRSGKKVVVDIIDPHRPDSADTAPKWRGLAAYAAAHSKHVRRVLAVIKEGDQLLALDLKRADVVKALETASNETDIRKVFAKHGGSF